MQVFQVLECGSLVDGPLYIKSPKVQYQSPKSGTNNSRTAVSIRWTRDMELTCMENGVFIYGGKGCGTNRNIGRFGKAI